MKALPVWFDMTTFNVYDVSMQKEYNISKARYYKRKKLNYVELIVHDEIYSYAVLPNHICKIRKIKKITKKG